MYTSLYLATLAGMMLGLAPSALAPNANAVPLVVIPQPPPELSKPLADPAIPPAPKAPGQNADNVEMTTYLLTLKDY